jgi:hypothetical protein
MYIIITDPIFRRQSNTNGITNGITFETYALSPLRELVFIFTLRGL